MRLRIVLLLLCVALGAVSGFAQGFQAQLISLIDPLTNSCSGGTPLPEGTLVKIFWDHNLNGPDGTDLQPPEGLEYQQVSFNQFFMNSEGSGPGYFISQTDFFSNGALPEFPTYYLQVCVDNIHWNSQTFTLVLGFQEVYFGTGYVEWNCVNSPCSGCGSPSAPTAVNATDDLCQHVLVTWNSDHVLVDSFRVRRDGNLIASFHNPGANPVSHTDVPLDADIHYYQVQAVRVCGDQSVETSPYVPGSPGELGRRTAIVPVPQNLTATTTLCDTIRFTYFVNTILGLDSVRIYRENPLVQVNGRLRGGAGEMITVNVLNEPLGPHTYHAVGFSFNCGESSPSNVVTGERFDQPTGTPVLTASTNSCTNVLLQWNDVADADSFLVRRGTAPTPPPTTIIARLLNTATDSYTDVPTPGTYYYTVTPKNECGEGTASNTANGIQLSGPAIPTAVNASDNTFCDSVRVTWVQAGTVDSFQISRTLNAVTDTIGSVLGTVLVYIDTTAVPGTTYAYRVISYNQCGPSGQSGQNTGSRGNNAGQGAVTMANPGPPNWDYTLSWQSGCLSKVVFSGLCPGTTAVAPNAEWTAGAMVGDSITFNTLEPLGAGSLAGFRLVNADTACHYEIHWHTGQPGSNGDVAGPGHADAAPRRPDVPTEYSLAVYPNPFNPTTTLEFGLPKAGDVEVRIFDIQGRMVEHAVEGHHDAGWHRYSFNATNLSTGVYFAHIVSGNFVTTKKLMLLK